MTVGRYLRDHPAYAGRNRQSARAKAAGRTATVYVPAAETPRPNKAAAKRFPSMAEDAVFLPLVRNELVRLDLWWHHEGLSIGSPGGFLDIAAAGVGGFMVRELKGSDGRLTVKQFDTIRRLREAGIDAGIWWPEDWYLGVCQRELDALTRPRPGVLALPPLTVASAVPARVPVREPGKVYRLCGCVFGAEHTCDMD